VSGVKEGADRIITRIVNDTDEKVKLMIAEANEKAALIKKEAAATAAARAEKIIVQARKDAAERKRRIIGVAELEARKEVLAAKQELIGEVFARSLEELLGVDDQTYLTLLRQLLLENVQSGTETVALNAKDLKRIPTGFWKEINEQLQNKGKAGKLTLASEACDIRGGFILLAEGVEINCSFEALLAMKRDELEPKVAALLFS
jgi:V/A-type H+/Na+-transporting ATPase subunit E